MTGGSARVAGYEVVIGLETHIHLHTRSKIFSGAATAFGAAPNTQACAVDVALPGTLPVPNREAVHCAIKLGLALGSRIATHSVFARKNYFYPDLPKGYQISQFERPIVQGGHLAYWNGAQKKTVRLVRAHLEEDAGKSLHDAFAGHTGIDFNRAGTPLLEIVTEPDLRSAAEAVAYARELHKLVTWIGICDGNMQEGSFRCDANVSVRRPGAPLGKRREIKNLNSFRFMQQAMDYEIAWQIAELQGGRPIRQATVLFDPDTGETRAMRSKEDSADYRYFPDPDLPPLHVPQQWMDEVRAQMPELPAQVVARFEDAYGLPEDEASALAQSPALAAYFEEAARTCGEPRLAANWIRGVLAHRLNSADMAIEQAPLAARTLGGLIARVQDGTISNAAARQVFDVLWQDGGTVDGVIAARGLRQMDDDPALQQMVADVVAANPANVAQFKAGKDRALNALVGQVMKASRGKANPARVNDLLRRLLA